MTGVWNEGEMSPGGREMATSSGEREERRPGLMDPGVDDRAGRHIKVRRQVPLRPPQISLVYIRGSQSLHSKVRI